MERSGYYFSFHDRFFIATVKNSLSWIWALNGLVCLIVILLAATSIYKQIRSKENKVPNPVHPTHKKSPDWRLFLLQG